MRIYWLFIDVARDFRAELHLCGAPHTQGGNKTRLSKTRLSKYGRTQVTHAMLQSATKYVGICTIPCSYCRRLSQLLRQPRTRQRHASRDNGSDAAHFHALQLINSLGLQRTECPVMPTTPRSWSAHPQSASHAEYEQICSCHQRIKPSS
jgi:hypothetical protein